MPELPEVETTTRGLKKEIAGLKILDVWTDLNTKDKRKHDTVADVKYFKTFKKEISGTKIISVERKAKNILINLSTPPRPTGTPPSKGGDKTILIHLKMTGHLLYGKYKFNPSSYHHRKGGAGSWIPDEKANSPLHDPYNRFIHVVFTLSNKKHLAFCDMRKFGKMTLLDTKTAHDTKHLNNIGPDPLEKSFNLRTLKERLLKKLNGKIKTVFMDQSVIAGIGNIYSDEILWRSGVHPERKTNTLKENELKLILKSTKELLNKGIDFGGDSMSDYRNIYGLRGEFQLHHEAYRCTGEKCRRSRVSPRGRKKYCKGVILRKIINGRSAHYCSNHQK
ncbi:MAG: Formamidopyrimidine-DNA glycosylase [Candidatus Nomurabacteria bacterium GW2011_GWA2_40_9]|uniref:Formamidopyrimidine-DNA glycosylase n=1 Tax=Candidatus Nomurabacteria bacterium GW2011_GWA2_40_9 TaxID=1618734 RepID=A0A0G0TQM3_9BACT|nr:MAG: Formamidopyrimidine-DNA glycosylase [Candidatus Nomurabacteria bacterium GW2011_GWA2_40_9]